MMLKLPLTLAIQFEERESLNRSHQSLLSTSRRLRGICARVYHREHFDSNHVMVQIPSTDTRQGTKHEVFKGAKSCDLCRKYQGLAAPFS
jgi:hypothetical protein